VSVSTAGKHEAAFKADADVYVTNIDAVKWLAKQPKGFFKDFDELIIDESTAYKHNTSERSKAAAKIAKFFKFRRAMTGTPNGNSITDVWHQVKILDDGKRLGPSFFAFRNAVCTPYQKGPNANALEWVDKDGAEEAVFGMLSDIVVRHKFEDCVDIPEQHQYTVSYQLTPQQLKAYYDMRDHAIRESLRYCEMVLAQHPNLAQHTMRRRQSENEEGHVVEVGRLVENGARVVRSRDPQAVVAAAAHHMDVQLGRHIADGSDVQLLHRSQSPHQRACPHGLFHQHGPLFEAEVLQLHRPLDARDQDQPGEAGVVLKPHMTQRPFGGGDGARLEGGQILKYRFGDDQISAAKFERSWLIVSSTFEEKQCSHR
jgi:hypothetical protein